MRIVHLVSSDFRPPDDGAKVKSSALASALARAGELHVIELGRHRRDRPAPVETAAGLPAGGVAQVHSAVGTALARGAFAGALARLWRQSRQAEALALTRALAPDAVVADDIALAPLAHASGARLRIAHLHNLESVLHREIAANTGKRRFLRKAQAYARIETELLPQLDQVWGVRQSDLDYLRTLGCRGLQLAPNVVSEAAFEALPGVGEAGRGLYFGSLGWGPNADGAREMVALSQRLRARGERFELVVAGRGGSPELSALLAGAEGIAAPGFVPSLKQEAARAAAVLVPLRWGGGTKVKTVEALALGKPILTTPEGAGGIDLVDGEHALIRPLGPAFDDAAVDLLRDPARYLPMALRGQALARARYSQSALDRIVATALAGA